jgi:hypothetical protein
LREEFLSFRRKIYLRTGHDDPVLAAALACWWIDRRSRGGLRLIR